MRSKIFFMLRVVVFILMLVFSGLLISCRDCSMETQNVRSVRLGFFKLGADGKTYTAFDTGFTKIYGLENDNPIYPTASDKTGWKKKIFELPLDIYNDGTGFVFEQGTRRDTLIFLHKHRYEVYTPDCGYSVQIHDFKVFKSPYPNYKIKSETLTSQNTYDFEIYP